MGQSYHRWKDCSSPGPPTVFARVGGRLLQSKRSQSLGGVANVKRAAGRQASRRLHDHSRITDPSEALATQELQRFSDAGTVEVAQASWLLFMACSCRRTRMWMSGDWNRCATRNGPIELAKQPFIERQRYCRKGARTDDRMSLPQIISGEGIAGTRFPRRNLQPGMALPEVLEDLPQGCAFGTKQYSNGYRFSRIVWGLMYDSAEAPSYPFHGSQRLASQTPLAVQSRQSPTPGCCGPHSGPRSARGRRPRT